MLSIYQRMLIWDRNLDLKEEVLERELWDHQCKAKILFLMTATEV